MSRTGWPSTPRAVAVELQRLAEETGDAAFLRAARALLQERPGRRPIDDGKALGEVRWLVDTGAAGSLYAACRMVARAMGTPRRRERSVAERLRRKVGAQKSGTQ